MTARDLTPAQIGTHPIQRRQQSRFQLRGIIHFESPVSVFDYTMGGTLCVLFLDQQAVSSQLQDMRAIWLSRSAS
jgi:hypothetical protein